MVLPPTLPASLGYLRPDGAYLLDNGLMLVLWLGRDVSPAWLTQVGRGGRYMLCALTAYSTSIQHFTHPAGSLASTATTQADAANNMHCTSRKWPKRQLIFGLLWAWGHEPQLLTPCDCFFCCVGCQVLGPEAANPSVDPSTIPLEPARQSPLSQRLCQLLAHLRGAHASGFAPAYAMRQGTPLEAHVVPLFVEDRAQGQFGYGDFLHQLHRGVVNK